MKINDETAWKQAAGELRGFAAHLERGGSGITAAQLRMAVARADLFTELVTALEEVSRTVKNDFVNEITETLLDKCTGEVE